MRVRHGQLRTLVPGLIAVAFLLSDVWANPVDKSLEDEEPRQCGAASPLLLSLGDAYFDIADIHTAVVVSEEDIAQNQLVSRLSQIRSTDGSGVRVLCTGSADEVHPRLHTVSLEEIESRQTVFADIPHEISITAYEYDKPLRRLVRETVTIPIRLENVISLTGQTLATSSRHRQATPYGSYLEEIRIDASINEHTISIDQSVYVNGTLAQWHTWTLTD